MTSLFSTAATGQRRILSLWFPALPSDRVLRRAPQDGPFALTHSQTSAERLYCLNGAADRAGLYRGMTLADARAFCPGLITAPADLRQDRQLLATLRRWATRYCPWVGFDGRDGLVLDVTGSTHLHGGEAAMLTDMRQRLARAGIGARIGLAPTRGAAWALARHGEGIAAPGAILETIGPLPAAALRLPEDTTTALTRLGLRRIADLARAPRAPLARRFGPDLLDRLDQALGDRPEDISPQPEPPHYGLRLTLPEPIGLYDDVLAGTARLLGPLCARLKQDEAGARALRLTLRRVDSDARHVDLRLARPLRDPQRILPLFERGLRDVDAGFGIDQLRIEAVQVEPLPVRQMSHAAPTQGMGTDALDDLITRLGTRIGLEQVRRLLPADSHIPERSFILATAAFSEPGGSWPCPRPRPLRLFAPEPIAATGPRPPRHLRWRRMRLTVTRVTGPERITPEWWLDDDSWRSGLRDYWQVDTAQGRRLWLYHTPQNPGWFVQGEFA
ncbi:MAG: DNA polymerase Y family protein [Marinibacterium sp.]|nr:DNA polymerase Y family protein [Marinibacterium sp.]